MKLRIWIGLLGLGILAGLITTFRIHTEGFVVYAKTDVLAWTLPLATYIFFSLTSAGLAFVSSIPIVLGLKRFEVIEKRTIFLEFSVLIGSFVCLILHLGSPLKVIYFLLSPNLTSPLWWIGTLYTIYFIIIVTAFWQRHTARTSRTLGILIFLIAIATSTTLGWLMGMTDARPLLNPSFLIMYFPLTAFVCGMAALLLFSLATAYFSNKEISPEKNDLYNELARIMGITAGLVLILFLWRSIIGGVSSTAYEYSTFRHMIGSISYNTELWLGMLLPCVLMLARSIRITGWGKIVASASLLIGMLAGRMELILSGLVRPLGQMAEGRPEFVTYMPSLSEVYVVLFGLSVILLIYTIGERYLKLEELPE
ncbi:MAG: polysulfide reductase NrfD [Deltaproteobacteria bacterium]|uniref:NrfD/PsrC family molybdoenzyme membrane anchor subunit n=1 Tax=Desulfobacula sp. TaxID=2593537 RepID=UPI0019850959|nr:polysulfide reductase NrfD [Candidatus Desulfobacula maris]MBL6995074.1 polysulfide reductase NrfD [Desulfobacula sp.]